MQLIREKLKFIPQKTQNFQINLSANENFNGLQQSINDVIEEKTGLSINSADDGETFQYLPTSQYTLNTYFFSGGTYANNYMQAGFTTNNVIKKTEEISRSFFIMQVYDTPFIENQILLHSGYFNGFNFIDISSGSTTYIIDEDNEFTNFYIPNWFVDALSGNTTLYGKLSFYNAKTNQLSPFFTSSATTYSEEILYFEIDFFPNTYTYSVSSPITMYEINNDDYKEVINDTLDSFVNQKPTYPVGTAFINTGKYVNIT